MKVTLTTLRRGLWLTVLLIVPAALVCFNLAQANLANGEFAANRAKLISYVLRDELGRHHYSHKALDDELSRTAFTLFLKQLDGQKRFLLQSDVDQLKSFQVRIDDELNKGVIELPAVAAKIMAQRVAKVRELSRTLVNEEYDFRQREELETDPEKLKYCLSEGELRDRWRRIVKLQILSRYLNLMEDRNLSEKPGATINREVLAEARGKVAKSLEQFFSRIVEEKEEDHFNSYFDAVTRAYDPHTNYMPPSQKEDFDISMRGSLEGIGATLREEDGYIKVQQVIPGSAAWRQGQLQAEDLILKVGEGKAEPVDITDMRLRDAVSLIRGKKGTEVRLTVRKGDGVVQVIPIVRDVVQIEETFVKGAVLKDEAGGRNYGYIRIPSFYRDFQGSGSNARNSTDDTRKEIERLKAARIDGLILDLRNNGGGALIDAVAIAGLFFSEGPVVQVKSSNGKTQVLADEDDGIVYGGPLVVLVNEFSASASEILAGALQDYRRAVIVGSPHTHGKGTVQAMYDIDRNLPFRNMDQYKPLGTLKVTIQKFYRISGGSTQYRGIVPDIVLPDRMQFLKTGEQYLENSLPWDTVPATSYRSWEQSPGDLTWLAARSRQRVQGDEKWQEIVREANRAKERSERTRQSLHIDEARRERAEEKSLAESMGELGGGHAKGKDGKEKKRGELLSEAEKQKQLIEEALRDPATREAMAIVGDVITGAPGPLAGTSAQSGRRATP